jgi:hypothetical protein
MHLALGVLGLVVAVSTYDIEEDLLYANFPQDFYWGVATSAYQVCTVRLLQLLKAEFHLKLLNLLP